ncbi:MAG: Rab family GTPase [Candidatus Kariarchaeaceae archaeon]
MNQEKVAKIFKILLLGDPMVGKTSLRRKYMGEGFSTDYITTLGADFAITNYRDCQLQIWDLAGHISFRELLDHYLLGGRGMIVVYDISRPETLDSIGDWIQRFIDLPNEMIPTIIVGNKTDLRFSSLNTVYQKKGEEEVRKLSNRFGRKFQFIETSALKGENIREAFENLVDEIIEEI